MDISGLLNSLQNTLGAHLPKIAGALGILLVGWIVAFIVPRLFAKHYLYLRSTLVFPLIQETKDCACVS